MQRMERKERQEQRAKDGNESRCFESMLGRKGWLGEEEKDSKKKECEEMMAREERLARKLKGLRGKCVEERIDLLIRS